MTDREIFDVIVASCRQVLPHLQTHAFHLNDRLEDLGANSMDRAEITMLTMETIDTKSPRAAFHGADNLHQLVELFRVNQ